MQAPELMYRWYLLRNRKTTVAKAIVEASSKEEACTRARILQRLGLLDNGVEIVASELDVWLPLPTFQQGFFTLFQE